MNTLDFKQEEIERASELLRSVAHNLRLNIISLLDEKGEINVNVIYTSLKLEQSITSQHLKVLRDSGVVNTRREGKMIYYSLNYDKVKSVQEAVSKFDFLSKERLRNKKRLAEAK